ncbi:MAG: hypothetical protein E7553_03285 [Ruminococcaceae bacterium]|nr:hypothetical protein [Oscillospiraceae bacterium]
MFKKALSVLLALTLVILPLSGTFTLGVSAAGEPLITVNIEPYAVIHPNTAITVTAQSGTLSSCAVRLEGTLLGTTSPFTFTPAGCGLSDGLYTVIAEATDTAGVTSFLPLTFTVSSDAQPSYTVTGNTVSTAGSVTYYQANALNFDALYGSSTDGKMDPTTLKSYSTADINDIRYTDDAVVAASVSGIPYQLFDVDLAGKTSGQVAVSYSGSTKAGERMAVKVFNPHTNNWDTIGTFVGTGSVSELVDVATYNTDGKLNVMAVLDYATNGSDTMIWSTDPQHYTKFRDLNEYYYKIYQYAAELYQAGEAGYIITTGDLVDDRPTAAVAPAQWAVSDKAMSYVEAVGMPNGLVSGNHDVADFKKPDYSEGPNTSSDYSMFAKTFPADRYNNERWYGGSINNNTSHYDLVTIGNVDFIIVYLGYGLEATDETIAWANDALKTYRHRTAIIATHEYLDAQQAVRASSGRGQLIYDKIVDPNPNVKMVLCGHDDGSLMLPVTASDGRTVYEILSDYQFVEAEDDDFYANEHYIGSVPECCGDGYIRLMTVQGNSLSSITYSPVTDRYNPYGDREEFTIHVDFGTADRQFATYAFSAAVLGNETTAVNVDRVGVVTDGNTTAYTPVLYANAQVGNAPATPAAPYYAHSASAAPAVAAKTDVLSAVGASNNVTFNARTDYGNYASSPLNLKVDLNKTPYLYYSVALPAGANFTFAFINNNTNVPWLTFRDASNNTLMNAGSSTWDSKGGKQYTVTSETGCIDMRTLLTNPSNLIWEIEQFTLYTTAGKDVTLNYFFFGSAAVPNGSTPVDTEALENLIAEAQAIDTSAYTSATVSELTAAISAASSASPYHSSVTSAYTRLANAIGGLRKTKATVAESSLTSIKNYTLNLSNFSVNSLLTTTQTDDGFVLKLPLTASQSWAAATSWNSYTVKPERGQVFLKLDVDAQSSWSIQMGISQNGVEHNVSFNNGIENAFSKPGNDGSQGLFQGIYDVSDSFTENGLDPASTFTVTYMHLYIVGLGGSATFNHVEMLTNKSDGVTDKTALQAAINRAGSYTQSLYTSASWSAVSTALSNAKSALSNTSLAESDLNLKAFALNNALDALVYAGNYPETAGSLLPADPAKWVPIAAGEITATRANGLTVIKNTTGMWPSVTYTPDKPLRVFVKDSRLVVDMDIGEKASILLNLGGENWVKINPYIGAVNGDEDLTAGTNTVSIPLSDIKEFKDLTSVTIYKVRVFSVGEAAKSAVTFRSMRIADYEDYNWSDLAAEYGVAATPSNPYYQHCAPYAPEVGTKVDLLVGAGLDAHHSFNHYEAYQNLNIKLDLNKTPYLYYSYVVPAGAQATFGIFSNNTYSPYFIYRDIAANGSFSQGVDNFNNAGTAPYVSTCETGCIDMRSFLKDPAVTTWVINGLSLYTSSGKDITFSYLFFGSAPTYVEQNVEIEAEGVMGDVNNDGKMDTQDLREVLRELLRDVPSFTAQQNKLADYNGDGNVSSMDIRSFLKLLIK